MSILSKIKEFDTTPENNLLNTAEYLEAAFKGELKSSILLQTVPEWYEIWSDSVWLCPDAAAKKRIQQRDKRLALTADEFFHICRTIEEKTKGARSVIECLHTFKGSLMLADDSIPKKPDDPSADLSLEDSVLWVRMLEMARAIDIDFAARLIYLRSAGCKLQQNKSTGFKLVPVIDETGQGGWTSQQAYDAEKWCLNPYRRQLVELFQKLKGGKE